MTTIELEARKALLVKEILTEIDNEELLDKLAGYLKRLKNKSAKSNSVTPPCQYTHEEMQSILLQREEETHFYTQDQVRKDMSDLTTSWK